MKILALDMSSTAIGVCYDGQPLETWRLRSSDIATRCRQAAALVRSQLYLTPDVDFVVIESPVARFASAVIPQARVSGAVLAVLDEAQLAWIEATPTQAKRTLTNTGKADKALMIREAERASGVSGLDEHQADAYGLWRYGMSVRALRGAA